MEKLDTILARLIGQLQAKNPQGYKAINEILKSKGDPNTYMEQMLGQLSPDAKQRILSQAKNCGCPDSILSKLQNMR